MTPFTAALLVARAGPDPAPNGLSTVGLAEVEVVAPKTSSSQPFNLAAGRDGPFACRSIPVVR